MPRSRFDTAFSTDINTRQADIAQSPPQDSHSETSTSRSQDHLVEPASDDGTTPIPGETELRVLSSNDNEPALWRNPGTGRIEDGTRVQTSRIWKAHHQDFYKSKWFKSLLWVILLALVSAAFLLFTFFGSEADLFEYQGLYFWLFCVVPLFGGVLVWLLGGVVFSKVFQ